jgi:hypothetical protein
MDGSPRLAAMQASKSLASSSRTWFSTGINKTDFLDVIAPVVLLSPFYPKGYRLYPAVSKDIYHKSRQHCKSNKRWATPTDRLPIAVLMLETAPGPGDFPTDF